MPWHSEPAPAGTADIGVDLLAGVIRRLQIGDEWRIDGHRRFTWWSHRLAQVVTIDEPRIAMGDATTAARARIDIVSDVEADDGDVIAAIDAINHTASLGALVFDSGRRIVYHSTAAYLHSGNRSVEDVWAFALMVGNVEAHGRAEGLAALLGGRPADSAHPVNGLRHSPDGMLALDTEIRRLGHQPSRYAGPVLAALADSPYLPWVRASGDESGVTGEVAFTGRDRTRHDTALVQITTDAYHPAWGLGALILTQLPVTAGDDSALLAAGLNRAETTDWTGFPQFGAWCAHSGRIAHSAFLPNYAADFGLFPVAAFYTILRALWASERLA